MLSCCEGALSFAFHLICPCVEDALLMMDTEERNLQQIIRFKKIDGEQAKVFTLQDGAFLVVFARDVFIVFACIAIVFLGLFLILPSSIILSLNNTSPDLSQESGLHGRIQQDPVGICEGISDRYKVGIVIVASSSPCLLEMLTLRLERCTIDMCLVLSLYQSLQPQSGPPHRGRTSLMFL